MVCYVVLKNRGDISDLKLKIPRFHRDFDLFIYVSVKQHFSCWCIFMNESFPTHSPQLRKMTPHSTLRRFMCDFGCWVALLFLYGLKILNECRWRDRLTAQFFWLMTLKITLCAMNESDTNVWEILCAQTGTYRKL